MRHPLAAIAAGGAALFLTMTAALAAPSKQTVMLHAPMPNHMMAIAHATGSALISYTAHDATITLTTEKLPNPTTLHENVYVLWLVAGKQRMNAGSFAVHNGMGGLHAMTMDTMFTKLIVSAEKSSHVMHPMGVKVLVGAVMHH